MGLPAKLANARVLLTGAGTSAYAASAIAAAWPRAVAVPTTDLLIDPQRYLAGTDAVISIARSGDSPESSAVVERIRRMKPGILQLAIVCNREGALCGSGLDAVILLDPRTNDRSLVMTSAFSNLVLSGLVLAQEVAGAPDRATNTVAELSSRAATLLPEIERACQQVAAAVRDRLVILSSSPLLGWGREAALKTLEMTAGRFPVISETYLGLRHGPMSFLRPDTVVLCLVSSASGRRPYELDLIRELRQKKLGRMVGIAEAGFHSELFGFLIPAIAPQLDDALRTPYEIVGPQLLGYYLSLQIGLNPDNPSPSQVITRVVQGVEIYPPDQD